MPSRKGENLPKMLNGAKQLAAEGILRGQSLNEAAKSANVGVHTLTVWWNQDQQFREYIEHMRALRLQSILGVVDPFALKAFQGLGRVIENPTTPPEVVVAAADTLLRFCGITPELMEGERRRILESISLSEPVNLAEWQTPGPPPEDDYGVGDVVGEGEE
jgi:hypothetical protein